MRRSEFFLPRLGVSIRPATPHDLDHLAWSGGALARPLHADRIRRQEHGEGLYLVAVIGDRPVGHAVLSWRGGLTVDNCPEISDSAVFEPLRGYGIGTALLEACEDACRARGYACAGIAVDPVEEAGARVLYERLGYRFHGAAWHPLAAEGPEANDHGNKGTALHIELLKCLDPEGAPQHTSPADQALAGPPDSDSVGASAPDPDIPPLRPIETLS